MKIGDVVNWDTFAVFNQKRKDSMKAGPDTNAHIAHCEGLVKNFLRRFMASLSDRFRDT